ncbi:TdeIII family type II restriction endonuclease [Domibacillus indicus]|uniref:TdeIII family type II restriction endonuclease n=1 Tax=Domibacillus indicus TaxID=1437523 RepID=UPI000617E62D|nr:TdeIII family type II restriction endonuclease [Domibacillus indicus]
MNAETKERVRVHIQGVMDRLIERRTVTEPFLEAEVAQRNPFGLAVVPIEVWKGAKFERSFVTTLGQGIFEQLGKIIAEGSGAFAQNQYDKALTINTFKTESIDTIIKSQRARAKKGERPAPNLTEEIGKLAALENPRYEDVSVKSDLYIRRPDGGEEYYSFKTVKPNLDQTAEAKRNLLLLRLGDPDCKAYFALPYNPGGEGYPYSAAGHSIPNKLFNMADDEYVLIGATLWNKIGNDENTYSELLDVFRQVGQRSSQRIRQEYFDL